MANTYSGDPNSSDKDAVRFLISDTSSPWLFTDEEILYALAEYGTVPSAGSELSTVMAGKYTNRANKTVGPLSINYGEIAKRWLDLSVSIRKRAARSSGAVAIMTQTSTNHIFSIGMHDSVPDIEDNNDLPYSENSDIEENDGTGSVLP